LRKVSDSCVKETSDLAVGDTSKHICPLIVVCKVL